MLNMILFQKMERNKSGTRTLFGLSFSALKTRFHLAGFSFFLPNPLAFATREMVPRLVTNSSAMSR